MLGGVYVIYDDGRPLVEAYDGPQIVGMDLHRRRSVLVRMAEDGQKLGTARITNSPARLAAASATAPRCFCAAGRPVRRAIDERAAASVTGANVRPGRTARANAQPPDAGRRPERRTALGIQSEPDRRRDCRLRVPCAELAGRRRRLPSRRPPSRSSFACDCGATAALRARPSRSADLPRCRLSHCWRTRWMH